MRCGFKQESHVAPSDIKGGDFILRYTTLSDTGRQ